MKLKGDLHCWNAQVGWGWSMFNVARPVVTLFLAKTNCVFSWFSDLSCCIGAMKEMSRFQERFYPQRYEKCHAAHAGCDGAETLGCDGHCLWMLPWTP